MIIYDVVFIKERIFRLKNMATEDHSREHHSREHETACFCDCASEFRTSLLLYRLRNMESDGALYVQTEKLDSEDPFSSGENE